MKKVFLIIFTILVVIAFVFTLRECKNIYAFYTTNDKITNFFNVGQISAEVEEPNYEDNKVVRPGDEVVKDPTLSNNGKVDSYIRAQVYVPISDEVKYVDENEEIDEIDKEIELVSYELNDGWVKVEDENFTGSYEDENGDKYKVYTYKYVMDNVEKIIKPGEKIEKPVFDKVKIINYLDMDKAINIKLHVTAIAVQAEGGTAEEMWSYYIKQNGTGIEGVR